MTNGRQFDIDRSKRRALKHRLINQGVPLPEVQRRVEALRRIQHERQATLDRLPVDGCATPEVCTPEVAALVLTGRAWWSDDTSGNRERFGLALQAFDGVL